MNAHLPGVTVHGRVASAEEFTKNHGVSVIPLLSGSGVRIKLLENGCHGIPTVSTSIGAEGYTAVLILFYRWLMMQNLSPNRW